MQGESSAARVVLDTNVVVGMLVFDDPALRTLRDALECGVVVPLVDDDTLAELARVLRYPELRLTEDEAVAIDLRYRNASTRVVDAATACERRLPRCHDADDQKFLELAQRGRARWLLTRDKALLKLRRHVAFAIALPEAFTWPARVPRREVPSPTASDAREAAE